MALVSRACCTAPANVAHVHIRHTHCVVSTCTGALHKLCGALHTLYGTHCMVQNTESNQTRDPARLANEPRRSDSKCSKCSDSLRPGIKDLHAPPLWEVPRREVRVMREDTLLHVSRRTEDTLKIHLCEDTRPGPNEEVYLHTKIHLGPNEDVYLHTKIHRGPNEVCILKIHRRKCIMLYL